MKHLFARERFHFSYCEPGAMIRCLRSLGHTLHHSFDGALAPYGEEG